METPESATRLAKRACEVTLSNGTLLSNEMSPRRLNRTPSRPALRVHARRTRRYMDAIQAPRQYVHCSAFQKMFSGDGATPLIVPLMTH